MDEKMIEIEYADVSSSYSYDEETNNIDGITLRINERVGYSYSKAMTQNRERIKLALLSVPDKRVQYLAAHRGYSTVQEALYDIEHEWEKPATSLKIIEAALNDVKLLVKRRPRISRDAAKKLFEKWKPRVEADRKTSGRRIHVQLSEEYFAQMWLDDIWVEDGQPCPKEK